MSEHEAPRSAAPPDEPPGYPVLWTHEVLLADGGIARVRPVKPCDRDAFLRQHERLSQRSRYLRYFSGRARLPTRELEHATHPDYVEHMAFAAFEGEQLIGFGCYDRVPGEDVVEVAFQIDDAHQGRGLGTILLEHLVAYAREHGFRRVTAHVLPENRKMLEVFREVGYPRTSEFADGLIAVSLAIDPTRHAREVIAERHRRALAEHRRRGA